MKISCKNKINLYPLRKNKEKFIVYSKKKKLIRFGNLIFIFSLN